MSFKCLLIGTNCRHISTFLFVILAKTLPKMRSLDQPAMQMVKALLELNKANRNSATGVEARDRYHYRNSNTGNVHLIIGHFLRL